MILDYTCAKHRIAFSLVLQRLSITLVVRNTELCCHLWINSFQLHFMCETKHFVVTGGAPAFMYTCAKHRFALSLVEQRLSITLVRNTLLRCHWCCNGYQLHLFCEAQNCVVTGGATAFNYTCAKHRIALSLVEQRLSVTLVLRNTELRCHWWSNGFQLHFLFETQNFVVTGGATAFNYIYFAKQNFFVTGGATAFNYTCAKHRVALSLVLERLSITLVVRNTELCCHLWINRFQLHFLCESQNCVVTGGATAFNYTCANHRFALSLVEQRLSITLVLRNTELRCHWRSNSFQLHLCESQICVVTGVSTAFNYTSFAKHRIALSLVLQRLSITSGLRNTELRCHWWSNGFQLHLCEAQDCVVTGVATAFNYIWSAIHRIAFSLVEQRLLITLVRNRIALSLVE